MSRHLTLPTHRGLTALYLGIKLSISSRWAVINVCAGFISPSNGSCRDEHKNLVLSYYKRDTPLKTAGLIPLFAALSEVPFKNINSVVNCAI